MSVTKEYDDQVARKKSAVEGMKKLKARQVSESFCTIFYLLKVFSIDSIATQGARGLQNPLHLPWRPTFA
jgi:hypothetical protein